MKRTRKAGGFSKTFTARRNAVERVNRLIEKGSTITNAVELVAREIECHPTTIYNWVKKERVAGLGLETLPMPTNNGTRTRITSVNLHVPGKGDITLDHDMLTKISSLAGFTS